MTPDDLVERVAAVIAYGDGLSPVLDSHRRTANAAIAVLRPALRADALEEAANVAKAEAQSLAWYVKNSIRRYPHDPDHPSERRREVLNEKLTTARKIAAAIRAMIGKEEEK